MAAPKKRPAEHSPSVLLSKEANDKIFSLVGLKCQVLSSGVADVLTEEGEDVPADDKEWQRLHPGVLVALTKDYARKSYFIQIYSFVEWQRLSEYVLTRGSPYHTPSALFHHFQNESLKIGLKFGSEVDAANFNTAVQTVRAGKRARPEGRPKPPSVPPPPRPPPSPTAVPPQKEEGEALEKKEGNEEEKSEGGVRGASPSVLSSLGEKVSSAKKKPVAKRISKEMIGKPTNFQHLCHVGFNPEAGFVSDEANHKELQAHFASKGDTPMRPAPPPPPPPPPPSTRMLKSPKTKDLPLDPPPSCDVDDSVDADDDDDLNRNVSLISFSSQDALDVSTDSVEAPSAILNSTSDSSFTNIALSDDGPASLDTSLLEVDLITLESPAPSPSVFLFPDADDRARDEAPAPPEAEPALDSPAREPDDPTSPSKPEEELFDSSLPDASPPPRADESRSSHDELDESTTDDDIIDILTPPTPPPPRRRTTRPQDVGRPPEHPPPPPPQPPSTQ